MRGTCFRISASGSIPEGQGKAPPALRASPSPRGNFQRSIPQTEVSLIEGGAERSEAEGAGSSLEGQAKHSSTSKFPRLPGKGDETPANELGAHEVGGSELLEVIVDRQGYILALLEQRLFAGSCPALRCGIFLREKVSQEVQGGGSTSFYHQRRDSGSSPEGRGRSSTRGQRSYRLSGANFARLIIIHNLLD
ncbi:MAG: hypothetical protein DLD55_05045 [candidate division SR1 bacterium]|nr:MAG: hypothetical protein DLD55_05045 [candidate division SR1 bacterium]